MSRGLRLLGHPLHAALVHAPMGLLGLALLWDAGGALLGRGELFLVASWTVTAGVALGLLAAVAGFVDYAALPEGSPAEGVATKHMTVMLLALGAFGASLVFRHGAAPLDGGLLAATLACDALGAASLGLGGWLGGELVYRHGVGRAPSAITERPPAPARGPAP